MNLPNSIRVLVLGASYALLPGIKLSLAGHCVTFVGREDEIAAMKKAPLALHIPLPRSHEQSVLQAQTADRSEPGAPALCTPGQADPSDYDFAILAMQEPHFVAPDVARLMRKIADAGTPCLSIMNLPPPCFLARLGDIPSEAFAGVYSSGSVWEGMDPDHFTLASPDAQALRKNPNLPGQLTVTLASNFKAAPFAQAKDQALLKQLSHDMSRFETAHGDRMIRSPVKLRAMSSLYVPLAKWPMLIAGNCRCLMPDGIRSIADAVHDDLGEAQAIYGSVTELARKLGAEAGDLVDFASYSKAAKQLAFPSSLARGLAAGAVKVERIDLLVLNLMRHYGMETKAIQKISQAVDDLLVGNSA